LLLGGLASAFLALSAWALLEMDLDAPSSVGVCSNGLFAGRFFLVLALGAGLATAGGAWLARRWFPIGRVVLVLFLTAWASFVSAAAWSSWGAEEVLAAKCPGYGWE